MWLWWVGLWVVCGFGVGLLFGLWGGGVGLWGVWVGGGLWLWGLWGGGVLWLWLCGVWVWCGG